MKIAIAQMEVLPGHPDKNTKKMLAFIEDAKAQHADLIIFPELAIPGYLLGDTWEQSAFLKDCESYGKDIIAASHGITVMFGNVAMDWKKKNNDGRVRKYNAFFIAKDGVLRSNGAPYPYIIKTLLPNYREFDDTRHFFSLQKLAHELQQDVATLLAPVTLSLDGKDYRVGCVLCEDGWSENYTLAPLSMLAEKKIDFFVNISASPYTIGKNEKRHRLFREEARTLRTPILYANNIGIQNNGKTIYTFDGSSTIYAADGTISAAAPAFQEELLLVDDTALTSNTPAITSHLSEVAQIHQALRYGIKHFLLDIHMKDIVIGVSGGIDSAVAVALYTEILGKEHVYLVNMPSRFNSETTKGLSRTLAENLGCHYIIVPIQPAFDLTKEQIEHTPFTNLSTKEEQYLKISSFVAENIQARDRSSRILAAISATLGCGFTCNANKTEMTVGYSTLYGDQSGFLSALADLWKFQVYELANYLNEEVFHREVIPKGILDLVPSAELSDAQNVDEGKGDPIKYPYHDYLFRSFVERWEKASPEDILSWYRAGILEKELGCSAGIISSIFPTAKDFIEDLERWWNLFSGMAVAKRIQAPPILAVSRRAYGFDHREAQNSPYYTRRYQALKKELLGY